MHDDFEEARKNLREAIRFLERVSQRALLVGERDADGLFRCRFCGAVSLLAVCADCDFKEE